MAHTLIEYVGTKPAKKDNVAGTGVVWSGKGDVKPVPAAAAAALLRFPDVWRLAESQGSLASAEPPQQRAEAAAIPLLGLTVLQMLELTTIEPAEAVRQLREAGHIPAPSLTGMHLADLLEGAGIAPSEALRQLQAAFGGAQQPQAGAGEQPHDEDGGEQDGAIDVSGITASSDLSTLDDKTLRAVVRANGLKVDCRQRGDTLRAAVAEALKAKAKG